ncbi:MULTISPECIES: hypothetical protein [Staphylococcus]|uniref:hypothetical protein n=1 Tax=Staphylococcus TaxID=1279 RepID=UPI000764217E|nr:MULTISPECIES: hypothetical protein [Staphylococcus]DAL45460.1 MAG TPA_asm: hypothetical protein [Caudoviricetes sp.]KXA43057.1 hypothetical protein HMPREF3215_01980 [Staphylococcus simulans]OFM20101.1 hypothetical protein HMPREF2713_10850 [Staphylococcus sp. HMSC059E03]OFN21604.1 hypothetical protein HMPREF2603_04460 [Staphylococcus sp. HMSC055C03]OHR05218.1 hypothetical protein HMPREF2721_08285 [Staphylococcus sp. HMSC078A12]
MFKQIFDKTNGTPKLIQSVVDEETGVERFVYDESKYTEEMPPSELYEPISYKNGKWQGISYEEWDYNRSVEEDEEEKAPYEPNASEIMLAKAQMQVTKTANQLMKSEKEQASLALELIKKEKRLEQNEIIQAQTMKELTVKEKRLKDMELQQAKTMLEITKMKGSN